DLTPFGHTCSRGGSSIMLWPVSPRLTQKAAAAKRGPTVSGRWRRLAAGRTGAAGLILTACVMLSSCGKNPSSPSSGLQVAGVNPGSGTTLGGTTVTINGNGFAA